MKQSLQDLTNKLTTIDNLYLNATQECINFKKENTYLKELVQQSKRDEQVHNNELISVKEN